MSRVALRWTPRSEALPPLAAAGVGPIARALALLTLARPDEALSRLQGVVGRGLLVLAGAADDLPWVDGVTYLGRDPASPTLLLPCTLTPGLHPGLLERALGPALRSLGGAPLLVLPGAPLIASLAAARTVSRSRLQAWLAGEHS